MGALAGIFGALSGIGQSANDLGIARQQASEAQLRQQAAAQRQQQFQLQQQEAQSRIQAERQRVAQASQPVPLGQSFTHAGKEYQRFQDPNTGALSVKELPGGTGESEQEATKRGLLAIGVPEDEANKLIESKFSGVSKAQHKEIKPDVSSPTGFSEVGYDAAGNEVWRSTGVLPPARIVPRETDGDTIDAFGNVTHHHSKTTPLVPGLYPAKGGATATPSYLKPPVAQISGSGASAPAVAPGGSVGTYKGLDPTGHIPSTAKVNPQIAEFANDILDGRDVTKIPTKARALAESVARAYGWKGQGSLTPAQQQQLAQVDNSLTVLSDPKNLKLFDSPMAAVMGALPIDPTTEGGTKGFMEGLARRGIPQEYATYLDSLVRLRGVIAGIRGFTGANNSNATADRLLAELPNFTNTKNSADAKEKLQKLSQEISIIKRLGYFLPETPTNEGSATNPAMTDDEFLKKVK